MCFSLGQSFDENGPFLKFGHIHYSLPVWRVVKASWEFFFCLELNLWSSVCQPGELFHDTLGEMFPIFLILLFPLSSVNFAERQFFYFDEFC